MKKLSIKELIKFRNKSDRSKSTFARNLKFEKQEVNDEGGGDYWISCVSAISNSYKLNDLSFITDKRHELEGKHDETDHKRTKTMYKRNIDILYNFESMDFKKWRPSKLTFAKKHKEDEILSINGLEVKAMPNHVFSFRRQDKNEIGAI